MVSKANKERISRIVQSAERLFGEEVRRITAPGGEGRSSFRLHFAERTVIATLRPNFRRTHLEAHVLKHLSRRCDVVPACLGVDGEIMFQSDVGLNRLNVEVANRDAAGQMDLAADAVSAIFRFHAAARKSGLNQIMPHRETVAGVA